MIGDAVAPRSATRRAPGAGRLLGVVTGGGGAVRAGGRTIGILPSSQGGDAGTLSELALM
jgi:hypothetical protein